jgi:hypothetical protein
LCKDYVHALARFGWVDDGWRVLPAIIAGTIDGVSVYMQIAAAAALYFAIVFGAGFLLGAVRVLWLEPRVGPIVAVLCEAPCILTVIVTAARWVPRVMKLQRRLSALLLMGIGALLLQQLADLVVGIALRGNSPAGQLDQFTRPEGKIYLLLLLAFAIMPLALNQKSG